jgi:hypothetical protein
VGLYADMSISHKGDGMGDLLAKRIGLPHDLKAAEHTRLATLPPGTVDYAAERPTYRVAGFRASANQYQLTIESDEHDLVRACETVWRAISRGVAWRVRPRLIEITVNDEASKATLLRASTGVGAALRTDTIGILITGVLALIYLVVGLYVADSSVTDDVVVGAAPLLIVAGVSLVVLFVGSRRGLIWKANA